MCMDSSINILTKPRILVNGCSHSAANIPDNIEGDPWPKILCDKINADLVNIADLGKSNGWILEETIRYLISDNTIDHVIIQYTDWDRLNFYRNIKSFRWIPSNIKSQIERLNFLNYIKDKPRNTHYHTYINEHGAILKNKNNLKGINYTGDSSQIFEIVTMGTLTNCLYQLCLSRNIGLTLINLGPVGDSKDDIVWSQIPNDLFLFSNNRLSSMHYHFFDEYDMPDGGHFEHAFHYEFANHVEAHYKNKTQIEGKTQILKVNPVYNYI
jgi:hypothetical protein